ncbi:LCP family protein [Pseudokineococcus sp. 1T1Z-3]|uniref:LCP family protein n=1 Tax=Pseudokineococcus sp. 1T1Z-3 TaxID=3132745 RepID=UPI0030A79573
MPSQPDARCSAAAPREEPRWGPSTTYRAKKRLRRSPTDGRPATAADRRPPSPVGARSGQTREDGLSGVRERRQQEAGHGRPGPLQRTAAAAPPPPGHGGAGTTDGHRRPGRSRARRRRGGVLLVALLVVTALVVYPVTLGLSALGNLDRVEALGDSAVADTPGTNILLVGSDSREGTTIGGDAPGARTDSILLLHVPSGGGPDVLVSLPRDSYVEVPGYYDTKINAAYSLGGASLLVDTVETNTGLHVDDYVETGFTGFAGLVDAVGGVEMCPETSIEDPRARLDIEAGCQMMDGDTALGYARTRYEDPTGDIGRGGRQRELMAAIAEEGTSPALLLNPFRAFPTASAGGQALTVDESTGLWDLLTFARGMRGATGPDGVSMTVPVASTDRMTNSGQVVDWDEEQADALWSALAESDTDAVRAIAEAQAAD